MDEDRADLGQRRSRVWGVMIRSNPSSGRLIFGLIVIALGILFTLDNLGIVDASEIIGYWPLFLVFYGLSRLTGFLSRQNTAAGVLFTAIGTWLFFHNLGYIHAGWGDLWPLVLVILGGLMVTRALARARGADMDEEAAPTISSFAFMSGVNRKVVTQDFRGGDLTAVMGGHDIDLRGAKISGGTAVIDVLVWWGGVELKVPEDWKVSCEAMPIMGGIDDRAKVPAGEAAGHLILKGLIVMGGVEVKN